MKISQKVPLELRTTDQDRAEIQRRYKETLHGGFTPWEYVFAPIKETDYRDRLIDLFNYLDKEGD